MGLESRVAVGFREQPTTDPGLVLADSGDLVVILPGSGDRESVSGLLSDVDDLLGGSLEACWDPDGTVVPSGTTPTLVNWVYQSQDQTLLDLSFPDTPVVQVDGLYAITVAGFFSDAAAGKWAYLELILDAYDKAWTAPQFFPMDFANRGGSANIVIPLFAGSLVQMAVVHNDSAEHTFVPTMLVSRVF